MSHVLRHMSILIFLFIFYGQSGEAYWWRVSYQWGLPRLVYQQMLLFEVDFFASKFVHRIFLILMIILTKAVL